MSAVSALFHLDGRPARPEDVTPFVEAQAHRGPDGTSVAAEGPVALGHCLLHTTAESRRERQPVSDPEAGLLLTADVRLDNRDELVGLLDAPSESTDPDLILAAYRKWGTSCAERLLGAFAFVLWDGKARHLFCATDHFGVKPLHYSYLEGSAFICATEASAVLRGRGVSGEIDDVRIADFLLAPVEDSASRTFHRGVHALEPAHTLVVTDSGLRSDRYWSLDPDRELILSGDAEYAECFREMFQEAVACRLRTDRPIGSMLSGGLDSSSVTSMAAHLLAERDGKRVRTYSAVYDTATSADEREYMHSVEDAYSTTPHYFVADDVGPFSHIREFVDTLPGPLTAGNLYINRTLYGRAGEDGCRVVLSGFDGDTTISHGVDLLRELRDEQKYIALVREIRAAALLRNEPWMPVAWSWMRGPVFHHLRINNLRRLIRSSSNDDDDDSGRTRDRAPQRWERLLSQQLIGRVEEVRATPRPFRSERYEHHHRLTRPILCQTSRIIDLCAGAAGVETRFPFLDRRLAEFCLSLPADQKLKNGWTRSILRRGTEGILPEKIRWRATKANLEPGFSHGFRQHDAKLLVDTLSNPPAELAEYVNPSYMAELLDGFKTRSIRPKDENLLFRVFMLAYWLRRQNRVRPT